MDEATRPARGPGAVALRFSLEEDKADHERIVELEPVGLERERTHDERAHAVVEGTAQPRVGAAPGYRWELSSHLFFYADHLGAHNLFRGVAEAVLGLEPETLKREPKSRILAELQARGLWLIDAVDRPVNQLPMPERRQEIRDAVAGLVARTVEAAPRKGVVICHGLVYRYAADPLKEAGVNVLHDEPLPFPSMGHRQRFVAGLRGVLGRAHPAALAQ